MTTVWARDLLSFKCQQVRCHRLSIAVLKLENCIQNQTKSEIYSAFYIHFPGDFLLFAFTKHHPGYIQ